jgi:beta-1,4-mannosyl-glycoprotein beta-1,4-N-acetylglucosaminyltransferase
MKIYDCFSYWDEDLLLDLRLNILNDFVDYFVIVEGNKTWQNNFKKLQFDSNRFSKFKDKIIYVPVEDLPNGKNPYLRENFQRNCITRGLKNSAEDDLIIISDLDEIPNPKQILKFKPKLKYAAFQQMHFYYKFNLSNKTRPFWYGSRISVNKFLKSPQWLRNLKFKKYPFWRIDKQRNLKIIGTGGWHFAYLQSPENISKKIKSFAHGEFNKQNFVNL